MAVLYGLVSAEIIAVPTDPLQDIPAWVLSFFHGRPRDDLQAWWAAVRRLYGPEGVRVDFRTMVGTASGQTTAHPLSS